LRTQRVQSMSVPWQPIAESTSRQLAASCNSKLSIPPSYLRKRADSMKLTEVIDYPHRTWNYSGTNKLLVACDWLTQTWDRFNFSLLLVFCLFWLPNVRPGLEGIFLAPFGAAGLLIFLKIIVITSRVLPILGAFVRIGRAIHFSLFSRLIAEKAPRMMISSWLTVLVASTLQ
jgi:hypothetical protein